MCICPSVRLCVLSLLCGLYHYYIIISVTALNSARGCPAEDYSSCKLVLAHHTPLNHGCHHRPPGGVFSKLVLTHPIGNLGTEPH